MIDMNETEAAETWDLVDELLEAADTRLVTEVREQVTTELARQRGWTFRGSNATASGHFTTLSDAEALGAVFGAVFFGPLKGVTNGR